jgi:hypothetical protein
METGQQNKMSNDCSICANSYTDKTRKSISCPYCQFSSCLTCIKRYMLETPEDTHCMSCRRAWDRDFIDNYLSIAFRKGTLKKHREEVLIDREKARLPLLQPRIEAKVQAQAMGKTIRELNTAVSTLQSQINTLNVQLNRAYRQQSRYEDVAAGRIAPGADETETTTTRASFVQKCPIENCRGFLSSQWKCGTCQTWTCSECLVPKGKERDTPHTCDENMKATAALIRKDTKPCPKCGMAISKVDGCDQMWCVACQTPFSWTTGRQVFGVVHNPHYYQWLRTQNNGEAPRVAGDIPCGGLVGYYTLSRILNTPGIMDYRRAVEQIHRVTAEILETYLPGLPRLDEVPDNGDLGVHYSLNLITEDEWKSELWKRETKRQKGLEIRQPLDLFANVSSEILRRIAQGINFDEFIGLFQQLSTLRDYVNTELEKIGSRHGCMTPKITDCWLYDQHGNNRREEKDTRMYVEKILILSPENLKRVEGVKRGDLDKIISSCMFLGRTPAGHPKYGIQSYVMNQFLSVQREIVRSFLGERPPILPPVTHTPQVTATVSPM